MYNPLLIQGSQYTVRLGDIKRDGLYKIHLNKHYSSDKIIHLADVIKDVQDLKTSKAEAFFKIF